MDAMDAVLCMRWFTARPEANGERHADLVSLWHKCTPPEISQEDLARLMGVSERVDPTPEMSDRSFSVALL